MKKILSIVLVALLVGGVAFAAVPGVSKTPGTGFIITNMQGGTIDQPSKTFRLVRFVPVAGSNNSLTLTKDSAVIWDLVSDDGVTVTLSTTSGDSAVAGIVVQDGLTPDIGTLGNEASEDRANRNWTWLQTYGLSQADLRPGEAIAAAGDAIGLSTSPGKISTFAAGVATPRNQGLLGFAYDSASASTSDVQVFVRCE